MSIYITKFDNVYSKKYAKEENNFKKHQVPGLEWAGGSISYFPMSWVGRIMYGSGISTKGEEPLAVETVSITRGVDAIWACKSSTWEHIASTSSCCCLVVVLCRMKISRMNVTCVDKHWTVIWRCCKDFQRSSILSTCSWEDIVALSFFMRQDRKSVV